MVFTVLNYITSEPGQWTVKDIADDQSLHVFSISKTIAKLKNKKLIYTTDAVNGRNGLLHSTKQGDAFFKDLINLQKTKVEGRTSLRSISCIP